MRPRWPKNPNSFRTSAVTVKLAPASVARGTLKSIQYEKQCFILKSSRWSGQDPAEDRREMKIKPTGADLTGPLGGLMGREQKTSSCGLNVYISVTLLFRIDACILHYITLHYITSIHSYIHTYRQTYIHTCTHTYIHARMHVCIHQGGQRVCLFWH